MDTACLQYLLTDDEKHQFNEEGYLVVEDALAPDQITHLTALSERCSTFPTMVVLPDYII